MVVAMAPAGSADRLEAAREWDGRVISLVARKRQGHAEMAYTLRYMEDHGYHVDLGFQGIAAYAVKRAAAVSRSQAREMILFTRRLDRLPLMKAAFVAGEVDWTKLREVSRGATPATEAHWLHLARTASYRRCRRESAVARGLQPRTARPSRPLPAQNGWVESALRAARAQVGQPLSREEALQRICRSWLQGGGRIEEVAQVGPAAAGPPPPEVPQPDVATSGADGPRIEPIEVAGGAGPVQPAERAPEPPLPAIPADLVGTGSIGPRQVVPHDGEAGAMADRSAAVGTRRERVTRVTAPPAAVPGQTAMAGTPESSEPQTTTVRPPGSSSELQPTTAGAPESSSELQPTTAGALESSPALQTTAARPPESSSALLESLRRLTAG